MNTLRSLFTRPFSSATMRLGPETNGAAAIPDGAKRCTVAAGCFWGVEHMYRKEFNGKGLIDAKVGYIGGNTKDPSYRQVCSGRTGHAEALQVIFDPEKVQYRTLLEFFYKMHDPTQKDHQGPDYGTQYRSAIFYHDDEQKQIAEDITKKVNDQWWNGKVVTQLIPAGEWYDAESYHQKYLDHNPGGYECPSHKLYPVPPLKD